MNWHKSVGRLAYGPGPTRLVLMVDQGIADFHYSLVPRIVDLARQAYPAHVSVVRRETPNGPWGAHEGEEVEFEYSSSIAHDETYYWLEVSSPRLKEVRRELGLPEYPPWRNGYHLTIGNVKHRGNP